MTISTTNNRISYSGNGVTVAFAFPYKFLVASDLKIYVGGVLKTLTTDYTVGTISDSGATVTFNVAPAVGTNNIVMLRDPDLLQSTDLPNTGPFPSSATETALDKLTLIVQRLKDLLGRSFTLVDSDTSGASTTIPTPAARRALIWAPDGLSIINSTYDPDTTVTDASAYATAAASSASSASSSAASAAASYDAFDDRYLGSKAADPTLDNDGNALLVGALYYNTATNKLRIYGTSLAWQDTAAATPASFTSNVYSGTGAQTAFTLSTTPASTASVFVFISGVAQRPTTDYTISGTTLTFVAAPALGTSNVLAFVASTVAAGTPDDGSVSTAKIQALAVTDAKLAQQYINDLTVVTFDPNADYVAIADNSDSGNKKKAAIRQLVAGTAVATTSGTSIDFTGIPSWAKRITVIFNGVSTNGTSSIIVQLGISTGVETSSYNTYSIYAANATGSAGVAITNGFGFTTAATSLSNGQIVIDLIVANTWIASGVITNSPAAIGTMIAGNKTLAGTLDRVRITTAAGADTFDAGSVNIFYE